MKDRIAQFLVSENISSAEFADRIGVQRSSVSHILNARNAPGTSFLQKMLSVYKNLNPRWLLLGEGEMFNSNEVESQEPSLFSIAQTREQRTENGERRMENEILSSDLEAKIKDSNINDHNVPNDNLLQTRQSESIPNKSKEVAEEKPESGAIIRKVSEIKDIERIIFFYKDKTFRVYSPAQ